MIVINTSFLFTKIASIKSEPVDLEFYEDIVEVISESTNDSDLVNIIHLKL